MIKTKIKIGMIGSGFMGQVAHLQNLLLNESCEIVAIADLNYELAKSVANKHNIENVFQSHTDMLSANLELDACVVITQRNFTAKIVFDVLTSGYNVFCEKPMAATYDQANKLVSLANEKNLIFQVGMMRRFDAASIKGKKLLDYYTNETDIFGKLVYVRIHAFDSNPYCNESNYIRPNNGDFNYPRPVWDSCPKWVPSNFRKDYEFFLNVYCHNINMMRFFIDEKPSSIGYVNLKNNMCRLISFEYENFNLNIEAGRSNSKKRDEFIEFFFEKGYIIITYPENLLRNMPGKIFIQDYEAGESKEIFPDWSWSFRNQSDHFVDCLKNREFSKISSGKETIEDIEIIDNIWKKFLENNH